MTKTEIARARLHNQFLDNATSKTAADVVELLGAVQAQDFAAAKWAVAQRTKRATSSELDKAFAEGTILRTHVLRPTWHFIPAVDILWMLNLCAKRVHGLNAYYYRSLELDERLFARSARIIRKALAAGNQLTRSELAAALQKAGVDVKAPLRLNFILLAAELDALICSGALRGKQHTYALLDERAPNAKPKPRDEAIGVLAGRYFQSHGPATLKDFAWWSGLSTADARSGLEGIKSSLSSDTLDGQTYWFVPARKQRSPKGPSVRLLPNYDEYIVAYAERGAAIDRSVVQPVDRRQNILFNHTIVIDGVVRGAWKRTEKDHAASLETRLFTPVTQAEESELQSAGKQYERFLGVPLELAIMPAAATATSRRNWPA